MKTKYTLVLLFAIILGIVVAFAMSFITHDLFPVLAVIGIVDIFAYLIEKKIHTGLVGTSAMLFSLVCGTLFLGISLSLL